MNKTRLAKRHYEISKRIALIRKQNESNTKIKQNERRQKRQKLVEGDIDSGKCFELATTNKIYVNGLILDEIKNEVSLHYTSDFELIGSILISEIEQKQILGLKMLMLSKLILVL